LVMNNRPRNHIEVVCSSLLQRARLLKSCQYPAPLPGGAFYFASRPFHELAASENTAILLKYVIRGGEQTIPPFKYGF
jgi:hypothetical protein